MAYKYREQPVNPHAMARTIEARIKHLADTEAHLTERIGRLHRIEHLHRPRVRKNNQAHRTPPAKTVEQVLKQAKPILAMLQADFPTPPGEGKARMRHFLAEEDAYREMKGTRP